MTLDEVIKHAEEVAEKKDMQGSAFPIGEIHQHYLEILRDSHSVTTEQSCDTCKYRELYECSDCRFASKYERMDNE